MLLCRISELGVRPDMGVVFKPKNIYFSSEIQDIKWKIMNFKRKVYNFTRKIIIFEQKFRIIKRKIIVLSENHSFKENVHDF